MKKLSKATMREIASSSQIDISDEKLSAIKPQVEQIIEALRPLLGLELAETEPQLIFRSRQE
jgi:Asp-tRNA(Asn)/Glu-tRNA(Gln) amidotransferase C subunit